MIIQHHFKEAFDQYNQHQICFRLLQEQAAVMIGLCQNTYIFDCKPEEITEADIAWLLAQPEAAQSYENLLGGSMYICETEHDLLQILGCDFDWANAHDDNWPNVSDMALSWDACDYLTESVGDPQWVMFLMCWNNAGGPAYYVPKRLWAQARVTDQIAATNPSNTN